MITARSIRFHLPMVLCAAITASLPMATAASAAEQARPASVPNEPVNTTATYGNWVLHCVSFAAATGETEGQAGHVPKDSCELVQTVQVQGQAQPLLKLAIGRPPGEKALSVTAVLPVNVSIPGRVHISADGKPDDAENGGVDLALTRCMPGGCMASAPLGEKMRGLMIAGKQGQLRFADAGSRMIGVPLSWIGFTQALAALDSKG
ncbi:MAG: invasion associated locus B family protein [Rhodobacteraceae bacterium]|nr:invasion associated locus B family protein [Paracoccaceae bacterium]